MRYNSLNARLRAAFYSLLAASLLVVGVSANAAVGAITTVPGSTGLSGAAGIYVAPNGDIFVAEENGHRVKKISSGVASVFAGTGVAADGVSDGDGGPATAAKLGYPSGVSGDAAGNIYISEYYVGGEGRVRKVDTSGTISTIAGLGDTPVSTTPILATSAQLDPLHDLVVAPNGTIWIATWGSYFSLYRLTPEGYVTRPAATLTAGGGGVYASPSGLIYATGAHPSSSDEAHKIHTYNESTSVFTAIAGTGTNGYTGNGGDPMLANMKPWDVLLSGDGTLFIAEPYNNAIRKISGGIISEVTTAVSGPKHFATHNGNLLFTNSDSILSIEGVVAAFPEPTASSMTPDAAHRGNTVSVTISGSDLGNVDYVDLFHQTLEDTVVGANLVATSASVTADFDFTASDASWEGEYVLRFSLTGNASIVESLVTFTLDAPAYQNWQGTITLSGDPAGDHSVAFGVALDASNTVLLTEDILAPPPPPGGSYIHLLRDGDHLLQDKILFADSVIWDGTVHVDGSGHSLDVFDIPSAVFDYYDVATLTVDGETSYDLPLIDPVTLTTGNHTISVQFHMMAPLSTTLGVRWRLFSLPGPTEDASPEDLAGRGVVTMFGWNPAPAVQNYEAVTLSSTNPLPFIEKGYFIFRQPEPDPADSNPNTGPLTTTFTVDVDDPNAQSKSVTLEPGWNLVGTPFNGVPASQYSSAPGSVFGFDGANYAVANSLAMFQGYWVLNSGESAVTRTITPTPAAPALVRREPAPSWIAPLALSLVSGSVKSVELGVAPQATSGYDAFDVALPPAAPVRGYSEFYARTDGLVARLSRSVIAARQEDASWSLVANLAEPGTLQWRAMSLPKGYRLTLESSAGNFDLSNDGSIRLDSGRSTLTARLAFVPPTATRLMTNYPNPFNPETWIPFELKEGSDVTVAVYDMSGNVVRRLDLGYREPGYYTSRTEAAYWDGQNELGERVSSGVYVVEFRAGDTRDLRKLTLLK